MGDSPPLLPIILWYSVDTVKPFKWIASKPIDVFKFSLENGNDIKLSGFGNFILRNKSPRPGRNPKTGEEVTISERRVVTFKSGLKLKSKLEAFDGNE